jgi:flagellar assembly protein FliH
MATIIRNRDSSAGSPTKIARPIAFNFEDMNDRASEYLEMVRAEAAKIVQEAHRQAEQIRRQAEAAGRKAAEEAAHKVLDQKIGLRLNTLLPALEQLIAELNDAKAEWLSRWEQSAVAVASAIAERVIRRELAQRPEISLDWIRESLRMAAGAAEITVHLNPDDYEHLGGQVERLAHSVAQLAPTDIVADPAISAGGSLVTTRYGQIDQQIEAQLARIQEELA